MGKINLAIIDNQALFRKGIAEILKRNSNYNILFEEENKPKVLEQLKSQLPDIVIIDLKLDEEKGTQIIERIRRAYPDLKIIVLTSFYNTSLINLMTRIGVNAFLSKHINFEELFIAIDTVYKDRIYFSEVYKDVILYSSGTNTKALHSKFLEREKLSDRELEVLKLICHEYTSAEISKKLFLSIRTVEGHRKNLLEKTGSKNTVGLVLYALMYKLVTIDYKLLQVYMQTPF